MVKHSNNSSAVFDHFVGLALKELSENNQWLNKNYQNSNSCGGFSYEKENLYLQFGFKIEL